MEPNAPGPSGALLGVEGLTDPVRVGQGSYGVVYRASQAAYGRTVAVKLLTSPMLEVDSQRRFERECRALGSLSSHPYIVTLHAAGVTADGHPYLIMDYLPGGSLAARISGGPLGWQEVADIGVKLAGALATAHEAGILHRDIKPENVLISAYGEPQLADFGVAKIHGGTATSSSTITGSLAHAAPEVISGVSASEPSDIWSLGSTLATLLLGHPPFHRPGDETLHPLITRILTQPPPDMRPIGVPSAICDVIEASLAKDSWERPQTAIAFGRALQDAQRSLGVAPTPMAAGPTTASGPTEGAGAAPSAAAVRPVTVAPVPEPEADPETATRRRGATDPVVVPLASEPNSTPRRRFFPGRKSAGVEEGPAIVVPIAAGPPAAPVVPVSSVAPPPEPATEPEPVVPVGSVAAPPEPATPPAADLVAPVAPALADLVAPVAPTLADVVAPVTPPLADVVAPVTPAPVAPVAPVTAVGADPVLAPTPVAPVRADPARPPVPPPAAPKPPPAAVVTPPVAAAPTEPVAVQPAPFRSDTTSVALAETTSDGPTFLRRAGSLAGDHLRVVVAIVTVAAVVLGVLLLAGHPSNRSTDPNRVSVVDSTVPKLTPTTSSPTTTVATTTTATTATTDTTASSAATTTPSVVAPTTVAAGSGGTSAPPPTAPRPTTRPTAPPTTPPTAPPTTPPTLPPTTPPTIACPPKVPNCH